MMATRGEIYLGPTGDEVLISNHVNKIQRSFEEFGRSDRTFGGALKEDITSRKYTFTILNNYVDQDALDLIYERHSIDDPMNLRMWLTEISFFKNFDGRVPVVRLMPFPSTAFPNGETILYDDVVLTFVEV